MADERERRNDFRRVATGRRGGRGGERRARRITEIRLVSGIYAKAESYRRSRPFRCGNGNDLALRELHGSNYTVNSSARARSRSSRNGRLNRRFQKPPGSRGKRFRLREKSRSAEPAILVGQGSSASRGSADYKTGAGRNFVRPELEARTMADRWVLRRVIRPASSASRESIAERQKESSSFSPRTPPGSEAFTPCPVRQQRASLWRRSQQIVPRCHVPHSAPSRSCRGNAAFTGNYFPPAANAMLRDPVAGSRYPLP